MPAERLASREWFRDARFGMFIHWGVYSLLGQGEWVMQNRPIAVPDYEWLASTFNPVKFDARAWVPDEAGFTDGHHLLPAGALRFSERFGREAVGPLLRGGPLP